MPNNKERRTVRVDLDTLTVYSETDTKARKRIGVVREYVRNEGARIRTRRGLSGPFISHRLTVKFASDDREWVGQIKNEEMTKRGGGRRVVILRPAPVTVTENGVSA